jgi:hypothetical protein
LGSDKEGNEMPMADRHPLIDPEPFSVLVGVAGIVGGVASVIATFKAYAKDSPVALRRKALDLVDKASDELRYLAADINTVQNILADAEISGERRFRPETTAFLKRSQFSRYEKATDSIFGRLRKLLEITNKLDRLLPRLPDNSVREGARVIDDTRSRLNRLFRDRDISIDGALNDLSSVIRQVSALIKSLRSDL